MRATPASVALVGSRDLSRLRGVVREACARCGFGESALMDMLVAATELGQNAIKHGGGGTVVITELGHDTPRGLRLEFADRGPGIVDLKRSLAGGYSTAGTLGRGLAGTRTLVDELDVKTGPSGTTIIVTKWKGRLERA